MARIRSWYLKRPVVATIWTAVAAAVVLLGLLSAAQASDQPAFCTTCHEMTPFYDAWSVGPHAGVSCVACHVDAGLAHRVSHKVEALGEVWKHVTENPTFPLPEPAVVPDERCVLCHVNVDIDIAGRSHSEHAGDTACAQCHATVGHDVGNDALMQAGIFDPQAAEVRAGRIVAAVGLGSANLEGHVSVACSSCHDMRATGCASCHQPQHDQRDAACTTCHAPAATWVFDHPAEGTCESCHPRPSGHTQIAVDEACGSCHLNRGADWTFAHPTEPDCTRCHTASAQHTNTGSSRMCTSCHAQIGSSWAFSHPGKTSTCTSCHSRPAGHRSGSCSSCHSAFASTWQFTHPAKSSTCTTCHAKPSDHRSGACTTCHGVGTSWAFTHPGSQSTCTACHSRPAGHSGASCTSCHSTSGGWGFRHPASTSCASCHQAPSNHYGSGCSSCHAASKSWGSASFSHPRVPGGEHSYRSFSCSSCHPSGYASYSCTRCHGPEGPDDEEDD